jgi:DNA-binding NarL/FixJ family response regulator
VREENKRVLVLESDACSARDLARVISRHGEPVLAHTVRDGLHALHDGPTWHAFVIGLCLPDGSGFDALLCVRRAYPTTPALLLADEPDAMAVNAAYDLNAGCIAKPIVESRIDRFLQRSLSFKSRLVATSRSWHIRYHLSEAEADVLLRSAFGETRELIAMARQSSPLTVKKQISALLQKTTDESLHRAVERLLREAAGA